MQAFLVHRDPTCLLDISTVDSMSYVEETWALILTVLQVHGDVPDI